MPAKRRARKGRNLVITPEIVAAYRRCRELEALTDGDPYESDGYREEYITVSVRLHGELLGRKPWNENVLDVTPGPPPDWMKGEAKRDDWRVANELRAQIEEADHGR